MLDISQDIESVRIVQNTSTIFFSVFAFLKRASRQYLHDFCLFIRRPEVRHLPGVEQAINVFEKGFFLYLRVCDKEGYRLSLSSSDFENLLKLPK